MKPRFILCLLLLSSQALAKKTVTKQAKARLLGKSKTKSISKSSKDEQAANNRGVKGETGSKNERKNRSETAKPKASEDKVSPTSDSSPGEKRSAGKSAKSPGQDDTSSSSNAALNDGRTSGEDSGTFDLSPFTLLYSLPATLNRMPLMTDYGDVLMLTKDFLQLYLFMLYDDALVYFEVEDLSNQFTQDGPRISFSASIKFIEGSMAYDDEQILSKIEQTFSQGPFASEYLQRLQALDSKNVFQQTQGVFFLSQYTEEPVRYHLSRGPVTNVGVAGAFAGAALIISVSAYIIHGGKTAKTSADKRQPKRQNSKEKEVPAKFGSKNEEQFESIAL